MKKHLLCILLAGLMFLTLACQAPAASPPAEETLSPAPTALQETPPPAVTSAPITPVPATPTPAEATPTVSPAKAPTPKPTKAPTPKPAKTPGELTLTMKQSAYDSDSAELKAVLKNGTQYTYTFGEASYLQQKTGGVWKDVPFKEPVAWIDIAYILKPGESKEITLSLSLFSPPEAGTYRLVKDASRDAGNGRSAQVRVTAEFSVKSRAGADLSGLTLTMKQSVYAPGSAELKATLKNGTSYACTFGEASYLQRNDGGVWKDVPFKEPVSWIAIAYILQPGQSKDVTLSLGLFSPLEAGTYRLVKDASCDIGNGQSAQVKAAGEFRIEAA